MIWFEHMPLVTPEGDGVVQELNSEVWSGMNVVVCGPSGCGKSSLFRILGEVSPGEATVICWRRGKVRSISFFSLLLPSLLSSPLLSVSACEFMYVHVFTLL